MLPDLGSGSMPSGGEGSFGDNFEKEIGFFLTEQRTQDVDDREKELNLYRSGSAPPTVNESLAAAGGLFSKGGALSQFSGKNTINGFTSEEELRSDPAYLSYYYSNVNLNPRLPPPLLSKEDWRMSRRFQGESSILGGIGDKRKLNRARVPTAIPPGFDMVKEECDAHIDKGSTNWDRDGLIGLSGIGLGTKSKSIAEILQDDLGHSTAPLGILSDDPSDFHREPSCDNFGPDAFNQDSSALPDIGKQSSCSYAAALGASLSRSTTPDAQLVARVPSPHLGPIGSRFPVNGDKMAVKNMKSYDDVSSGGNESFELVNKFPSLAASFSAMNLTDGAVGEDSDDFDVNQSCLSHMQGAGDNLSKKLYKAKSFSGYLSASMYQPDANMLCSDLITNRVNGKGFNYSSLLADRSFELQKSSYTPGNTSVMPYSVSFDSEKEYIRPSQHCNFNGCSENQAQGSMIRAQLYLSNGQMQSHFDRVNTSPARVPSSIECRGGFINRTDLNKLHYKGADSVLQQSYMDPMYLQGLRNPGFGAAQVNTLNDSCMDRDYLRNSHIDVFGLQKSYLGGLVSPQKAYYSDKSRGAVNGLCENHPYDVGVSHPGSPLASPYFQNSFVGPGSPIMDGGFNMSYPYGVRNSGVVNPWHLENEFSIDGCFTSSLLEEFKSNKAKPIELLEISGHVVEFSADQYGSRFIQQKLETATVGERDMVFEEIMPHALSLMTDVFGNYVVQKFFEYGAASQRRELANKLTGHVLSLSLQMYGCRVIQKAIEVVDVDQKIVMVGELDGQVMRCVRDQNGNHVIQKCIECVPEDSIQFIVTTFFGQVVSLSTHPYGCRVVQRILEHCNDPKTQSQVMDEIMSSVCMLAQDQYGNYVVQHVLEHGKLHERSAIIKELAGKVVQMSQQKFASNVVEKCLTFGGPSERQLLVTEILGSTDENEPLQAMMKDQFANYVVQKVLETCDDQQREIILSRIKVHLNALKKYTYGKHIVARVEKLVIAGERRSGQSVNAA